MKRLRSLRGHVHLWLMMALILTLLLTVYVSAIVLSYRFSLEERYAQGLRLQLNEGLYELTRENFSGPACEQLSQQGIRMMILRDEDGKLLYREGIGLPFSQAMRQSATGNQTRLHNNDAETLLALVNQTLGTREGQFFLTDEGEKNGSPRRSLESKDLMLCGRKQGRIFCLFLNRKDSMQGAKTIIRSFDYMKKGVSIFIFPEGTRSKSEDPAQLGMFHNGSFKAAQRLHCPVVPVAILGAEQIFEAHLPIVKAGRMVIHFGKPVLYEDLTAEQKKNIGDTFADVIRSMIKEDLPLLKAD